MAGNVDYPKYHEHFDGAWQIAILLYLFVYCSLWILCICCPKFFEVKLNNHWGEYFVGCFLPIPVTVIKIVKRFTKNSQKNMS